MENKIRELVGQLLNRYKLVEQRLSSLNQIESQQDLMRATAEIYDEMTHTKSIESQLRQLREQFEATGASYAEETRQLVEESKSMLAKLIHELKTHEENARRERASLAPQIHDGVRAKKMHRAYTNSG